MQEEDIVDSVRVALLTDIDTFDGEMVAREILAGRGATAHSGTTHLEGDLPVEVPRQGVRDTGAARERPRQCRRAPS